MLIALNCKFDKNDLLLKAIAAVGLGLARVFVDTGLIFVVKEGFFVFCQFDQIGLLIKRVS